MRVKAILLLVLFAAVAFFAVLATAQSPPYYGSTTPIRSIVEGPNSLTVKKPINSGCATQIFIFSICGADTNNALFSGLTKAIRISQTSLGTIISGVDSTGSASYQPLTLNGSLVSIASSGVNIASFPGSGGVQLAGFAQPACAAGTQGTFQYTAGGAGVKDSVAVCAKDAANAYAWRTIY